MSIVVTADGPRVPLHAPDLQRGRRSARDPAGVQPQLRGPIRERSASTRTMPPGPGRSHCRGPSPGRSNSTPMHGHFHFPLAAFGLYTVAANGGDRRARRAQPEERLLHRGLVPAQHARCRTPARSGAGARAPTRPRSAACPSAPSTSTTTATPASPFPSMAFRTEPIGSERSVDPFNYLVESDETNNETDVKVTISNNTVTVIATANPSLDAADAPDDRAVRRRDRLWNDLADLDQPRRRHWRSVPARRPAARAPRRGGAVRLRMGHASGDQRHALARRTDLERVGYRRHLGGRPRHRPQQRLGTHGDAHRSRERRDRVRKHRGCGDRDRRPGHPRRAVLPRRSSAGSAGVEPAVHGDLEHARLGERPPHAERNRLGHLRQRRQLAVRGRERRQLCSLPRPDRDRHPGLARRTGGAHDPALLHRGARRAPRRLRGVRRTVHRRADRAGDWRGPHLDPGEAQQRAARQPRRSGSRTPRARSRVRP